MWSIVTCIRSCIYTYYTIELVTLREVTAPRIIGFVRITHNFAHDAHIHLVTVCIMFTLYIYIYIYLLYMIDVLLWMFCIVIRCSRMAARIFIESVSYIMQFCIRSQCSVFILFNQRSRIVHACISRKSLTPTL